LFEGYVLARWKLSRVTRLERKFFMEESIWHVINESSCIVLFHFGLVTESQRPLCVGLTRFQFVSSRDPLHRLRHCFQADDAQSKECQVKYLLKLLLSVTQVKRLGLYVFKVANKKMSQFSFKFRHLFAGSSLPNL
jgi:hypothetical protein